MKRADPPVPPPLSRAALREAEELKIYHAKRELIEHRSLLRGLIFLAVLVVLFAILHGGADRAFPDGWWRQW